MIHACPHTAQTPRVQQEIADFPEEKMRSAAASEAGNVREGCSRIGFITAKSVGNAVQRNQVKRRLRHLVKAQLPEKPLAEMPHSLASMPVDVVIRALPAAQKARSGELQKDLERCLRKALKKAFQ